MEKKIYEFKLIGNDTGKLIALEANVSFPIEIKRIYYIFSVAPGERRGKHAHKKTKQVAICLVGSCTFELYDGHNTITVILDSNDRGLYLDAMVWHDMYNFSPDCILLVIADSYYSEDDYIRDKQVFTRMVEI